MTRSAVLVLLIPVLAALAGCAPISRQSAVVIPSDIFHAPAPPEARALWEEAEAIENSGNLDAALQGWERVALFFPNNSIAPKALTRAGRLCLKNDRPDQALQYFESILSSFPQWDQADITQVDRLEALWARGERRSALKTGLELWETSLDRPEMLVRLSTFLAKAHAASGDPGAAFDRLSSGYANAQTADERRALDEVALQLASSLEETAAQTLFEQYPGEPIGPFLEYAILDKRWKSQGDPQTREKLLRLLARYPTHPVAHEIQEMLHASPVEEAVALHVDRIGSLLPLSGPHAPHGRNILRGLALAVEDWNRAASQPITLVVKDTQAQPEQAVQAFETLVRQEGVLAVIGPLSAPNAAAVAAKANRWNVPLLTLTQKDSVDAESPFLFHAFIDNRDMLHRLVSYCVEQLGMKRFGVLRAEDRYGNRLAGAFKQVVEELGGELVAESSYRPGSTDFREPIQRLLKAARSASTDAGGHAIIEALFIPDQAQTVALIAPQLPYYGVVGATLLGTNLWEDPALLSIGGVYVENALFPAALPLKDNPVSTPFAKFSEKHRAVYGEEPDYLSAQAYDTLTFLLEVGRKWNVRDRFPLRQALMDSTDHEGILGALRFRPDGRLERDYPIFQVMNGDLVQVWP